MPYSSMKDINPALKGIKPPITLAQANHIARMADAIEKGGGAESPWAVAIGQFKDLYVAKGGKWMKRKKERATEERIRCSGRITEAVEGTEGKEWGVTLIEAGLDEDGRLEWDPKVLEAGVHLFEGAKCFDTHLTDEEYRKKPYRPTKGLLAVYRNVWWDPTGGRQGQGAVRATMHVVEQWLRDKLLALREAGQLDAIGLSIDSIVDRVRKRVGNRTVGAVIAIRKVLSVDVVGEPAAGGRFERLIASKSEKEVMEMGMTPEELQKLIDERVEAKVGSMPAPVIVPVQEEVVNPEESEEAKVARIALEEAERLATEAQKRACATLLTHTLGASKLPQAFRKTVEVRFADRVFEAKELDEAVKTTREALAEVSKTGEVRGLGASDIGLGTDPLEQIQWAADRLFGAKLPEKASDVPRLTGIRELYHLLTGDLDMRGVFNAERVRVMEANVNSTTCTSIVKNALNKVLLSEYNKMEPWWRPVVAEDDYPSMQDITLIKTGGVGDLPTVLPGAAYTELVWGDIEETAEWIKKGGYIGITMEAIDKDDVAAIRRIPRELGAAARRTLSAAVAALFTVNAGTGPAMTDGFNVFDAANHVNLLTTALSAAQWEAVIQAVFKQTEPVSGKRIGLRPSICLVPIELEKTAHRIFDQRWDQTGTAHFETTLEGGAQVIAVPEWTDVNNWAAAVAPAMCEAICLGYRFGREPELFTADDPTVGAMFTNDELRIKVRFIWGLGVADHRPLHKSNVAG